MGKMKLNYKGRENLRSAVRTYIASQDCDLFGKKIKLDKETIESLLFEEVVINPIKGIKVKLPVFSGNCLQCIDLSEVSFEDVSWGLLGENDSDYFGILSTLCLENGADKKAIARIGELRRAQIAKKGQAKYGVEYTYTNAVIDLSKSFEAKRGNCVNISSCFFAHNDNMVPNSLDHVAKLNIADSNVSMPIPKNIILTAVDSDLNGTDLSTKIIDGYDYIAYGYGIIKENDKARHDALGGCNIRETGISIELVPGKFKQAEQSDKLLAKLCFVYSNQWRGCYVNNKLDRSQKESAIRREELKNAYDDYEKTYIEGILDTIKKQAKK